MPPGHQMLASPDAFADGHLVALDRQVELSDEQNPQLRAVFLEEGKNLFAVFDGATLSGAQKQTRIQQIHVITAHKVRDLLAHEQRKTMTETASAPASDAIFWLPANLLI